jgi:hypothetical protein
MAKRQSEEVAVHLSRDFDAFYRQPLVRAGGGKGNAKILVITADGKGIAMHPNGINNQSACWRTAPRTSGSEAQNGAYDYPDK